ncbi:GMC family oxidoreductase [Actinomadura physcomitrii]|uniref:GMC family oxidoreductase n=1 Tax=Actinomadura physcomitrii TaxID=2650748 RepID=UPI001923A459|nr:GMC family oxidoreductase N-terminal domain-containing protein [Actinomadura physcomitrii]
MTKAGFDVVIVGGGSAGCVLAARLSENPARRVLLLEAGPADRNLFVQVPAGVKQLNAGFNWRYEAEPDASRGGVVETWAAGRLLGGSSSINGMMWVRGHTADYDAWAAEGCPGWDFASLEPYFRRAEHYEVGGSEARGYSGPLHVTPVRVDHPVTDLFLEGAQKAGHPLREDYNGAVQTGVGYSQVSQRRGWRHSTARAYLAPARRRRNLTVRTGAEVLKVLVENGRATGVLYRHGGRLQRVRAESEVVLSAGTLATPRLLMLSGIGPAGHLRDNGIDVAADLPGVGSNLQEHPITLFLHQLDMRTLNQELTPGRVLRHGLDYLLRGRGAVASPSCHAMVYAGRSDTGASRYQMMFSPFGVVGKPSATRVEDAGSDGDPLDGPINHDVNAMKLLPQSSVTTYPCLLHPGSRGSVRLRPDDPGGRPVISMELLGERSDLLA